MKRFCSICAVVAAFAAECADAQDFLDEVDDALTFQAFDDRLRTRISGLMDLEGYYFQRPAPGLITATGNALLNPRLTLFLDAQWGPRIYAFVQSRVDRGFDPSNQPMEARADEYAVRLTPWNDGRLSLQAGKFATVVGNWIPRHQSWQNPFVTAPLPYEHVTGVYDSEAPSSPKEFLAIDGVKYEYTPVIWGPSYATGVSLSGQWSKFDYAAEVKNASLSSRPETWDATRDGFANPTASMRLGLRPNQMWSLGISASDGSYLRSLAEPTLPPGPRFGHYHESVLAQDIGFAWRHFEFWAEAYEARFNVPRVGSADTIAYYLESKYKLTPQLFGALRWNQQLFGRISDGEGGSGPWGHDIWRADAALGYRFTTHAQLKFQYSIQSENSARHNPAHLVAAQFTVRF